MKYSIILVMLLILCNAGCSTVRSASNKPSMKGFQMSASSLPIEIIANSLILIPVTVNGSLKRRFLLDSGAGIEAISQRLCDQIGCKPTSAIQGKRMSGEEVNLPTTMLSLDVGGSSQETEAGITNIFDNLPKELGEIDGAISLKYFKNQAFTLDLKNKIVTIESEESLKERAKQADVVPAIIKKQTPKTLGLFLGVKLFGNSTRQFEVDTGNSITILPLSRAKEFGVSEEDKDVKVVEGKNETGHPFKRVYKTLQGKIEISGTAGLSQENPKICFENIIYDGVIGIDFLNSFVITFDIQNKRLLISS